MSIRQKLFPTKKPRASGLFESIPSPTALDSGKKNRRVSNASDLLSSENSLLNTSLFMNPSMSEDTLTRRYTIETGPVHVDDHHNNHHTEHSIMNGTSSVAVTNGASTKTAANTLDHCGSTT